jgi:hypothetical protein
MGATVFSNWILRKFHRSNISSSLCPSDCPSVVPQSSDHGFDYLDDRPLNETG